MTATVILSRIDEIERELSFLRNQVRDLAPRSKTKTFGDLYGVWEGKVNLSEEEFKGIELRFKPFPS